MKKLVLVPVGPRGFGRLIGIWTFGGRIDTTRDEEGEEEGEAFHLCGLRGLCVRVRGALGTRGTMNVANVEILSVPMLPVANAGARAARWCGILPQAGGNDEVIVRKPRAARYSCGRVAWCRPRHGADGDLPTRRLDDLAQVDGSAGRQVGKRLRPGNRRIDGPERSGEPTGCARRRRRHAHPSHG